MEFCVLVPFPFSHLFRVCIDTSNDTVIPLEGLEGELFLRFDLFGSHVDDFLCKDDLGGLCRVDT